jgi:hypothetical protein
MEAFEELRKPRTERIQDAARSNMLYWQLTDGQEQEKRDTRGGHSGHGSKIQPDRGVRFGEPGFQRWLFSADVVQEAAELSSLL